MTEQTILNLQKYLKNLYQLNVNVSTIRQVEQLLTPTEKEAVNELLLYKATYKHDVLLLMHIYELILFLQADLTCIIGRSGSGKSTLEQYLCDTLSWKSIESYTTRPPRVKDERDHVFITEKELQTNPQYAPSERVAETTINGYTYFATHNQLRDADIYIIDPIGFKQLLQNAPQKQFNLIYLWVDGDTLMTQLKSRAQRSNESERSQRKRLEAEHQQFTQFENTLKQNRLARNIKLINPKVYFKNYFQNNL